MEWSVLTIARWKPGCGLAMNWDKAMLDEPFNKHFSLGRKSEAKALIEDYHYLGNMPSLTVLCGTWHEDGGLFGDQGEAIAACLIGIPACRWSEPVYELTRLVKKPGADVRLTGLISLVLKHAKRKGMDLIVSYPDEGQGHQGGIYRAASWRYVGVRDSRPSKMVVDGRSVHARSVNSQYGTSSPKKLEARGHEVQVEETTRKHLFVKPFGPKGKKKAQRLGLL